MFIIPILDVLRGDILDALFMFSLQTFAIWGLYSVWKKKQVNKN
jgi:hypothetical protein